MADQAAQWVVSLPDFSLPATADLPEVVGKHSSLLKFTNTTVNYSFTNWFKRFWWLFSKVCQSGGFGLTFALQPFMEYLEFSCSCAVQLVPHFLNAPTTILFWLTSGRWPRAFPRNLWALSPVSDPAPPGQPSRRRRNKLENV